MVWHQETELPPTDLIVIPGGFSYGDYLRAGAMAARAPVMRAVIARAESGTPVLAICNGFQIATEAGLLPGVLMRNASLKFICRDVTIRTETTDSPFTAGYKAGQVLRLPVGHADGNYFAEPDVIDRMEQKGQIAFRYCSAGGEVDDFSNPNGSVRNIAGVYNERRNVLGMMPHPERLSDPLLGGEDGKTMFVTLVKTLI